MRKSKNRLMHGANNPWTGSHGQRNQYAIQCQTANITNVTHVTEVHVDGGREWKHRKRKHGHKDQEQSGRIGRPPKLFRFFASCGILDRDIVEGMGNGQIFQESANIVAYGAKGLSNCTCRFAKGFASDVGEAASGLFDVISGVFGLFRK